MAERYTKVFSLESNLYSLNVPVLICAGALSKDNQLNKVFVQLRFQNIDSSFRDILALKVSITAYDPAGNVIGTPKEHLYLDLNTKRGFDFGGKEPVYLEESSARSFSVSVLEIVFSEGKAWSGDNGKWRSLGRQITLEESLGEKMAEQYRRDTFVEARYELLSRDGCWMCACGAWNPTGDSACCRCHQNAVTLFKALDHNVLAKNLGTHTDKTTQESKKKKTIIALSCLVFFLVSMFIGNIVKKDKMVDAVIGHTTFRDELWRMYFYDEDTFRQELVGKVSSEYEWKPVITFGNNMVIKFDYGDRRTDFELVKFEKRRGNYYVKDLCDPFE